MSFTIVASGVSGGESSMHSTGIAGGAWSAGWGSHVASTHGILQKMGMGGDGINLLIPCVDPCNRTCMVKTVVPLVAVFGSPIPAAQALAMALLAGAVGLA